MQHYRRVIGVSHLNIRLLWGEGVVSPPDTLLEMVSLTRRRGSALLLQQPVSFHQEALHFLLVPPLQLLDHPHVRVLHGGEAVLTRGLKEQVTLKLKYLKSPRGLADRL